jgi:thymidylate kinase
VADSATTTAITKLDSGGAARLLTASLEAVEKAGLRCCILRGFGEGAAPSRHREVDILVDAEGRGRFGRVVSSLGFVPLGVWGHGDHRFYVAYVEDAGEWLKLDTVTCLRYGGRSGALLPRALAGCLDRRRRAPVAFVPEVADALLGLLLHGVLDKKAFRDEHRRELERLRVLAEADDAGRSVVMERFEATLGTSLPWPQANALIAAGAWERLLERRRRIAWEIFRQDPLGSVLRWMRGKLERLLRPLFVAMRRRGFSIALMGPDGAGKSTLARALARDAQFRARVIYMGSNVSASTLGLPTSRWIERQRSALPAGRGGSWASLLGAIAYANRLVEQVYRSLGALSYGLRGRFVVFDRHPYEISVAESARSVGGRLRRRLLRTVCPQPDIILLLDAPPEVLHARRGEHTLDRLRGQRERYRSLTLAARNVIVLDASASEEETARRATAAIWSRYRQRIAGTG